MASTTDPSRTVEDTWNLLRGMLSNLETLDPEGSGALQDLIRTSGVRGGALRAMRHMPLEGTLSMRELVTRLDCNKAYATHVVDELEQHGYVTRQVDPSNRRSKVLELTSAGRAIAQEARFLHERAPATLRELSGADLQTLHDLLRRVDNTGRRTPATGAQHAFDPAPAASRPLELRKLRRRGTTLQ